MANRRLKINNTGIDLIIAFLKENYSRPNEVNRESVYEIFARPYIVIDPFSSKSGKKETFRIPDEGFDWMNINNQGLS